ncbi:unnamed protein product [Closterium sp. NIES-54]
MEVCPVEAWGWEMGSSWLGDGEHGKGGERGKEGRGERRGVLAFATRCCSRSNPSLTSLTRFSDVSAAPFICSASSLYRSHALILHLLPLPPSRPHPPPPTKPKTPPFHSSTHIRQRTLTTTAHPHLPFSRTHLPQNDPIPTRSRLPRRCCGHRGWRRGNRITAQCAQSAQSAQSAAHVTAPHCHRRYGRMEDGRAGNFRSAASWQQ